MFKSKTKTYLLSSIAICLYLSLISSVVFLMKHVQTLLNNDIQINLSEVVTQNKDVITSKIKLELNNINLVATRLTDRLIKESTTSYEMLNRVFLEYAETSPESNLFISDLDGNAMFSNKEELSIAGRTYFKLAKQNINNISDRIVSRKSGDEIFVICVPLTINGELIGTLQKYYTPEEMYEICSISLFSSEGYMYIINAEGYILISSRHDEYSHETENYFRMIYAQNNQDESEQLINDIPLKRSGFIETTLDGKKTFSAYTPIEDIHDWYLISSVATSAVSSNANIVIKMFYLILFFVVFILGGSLLMFRSLKNKQQKTLKTIAFYDEVTQGNTYNKFIVDLQAALNEDNNKNYFIMKFDIDNFKYVNNFYGFDAGDKILYQIYHSISKILNPGEMIARVSSDHFVVLLEDVHTERLNDLLEPIENGDNIVVNFSAGIYAITNRNESINLMVDKAGTAASFMKGSLQDKFNFYSEDYDQMMIRNEQLKRNVKLALTNNEIVPYFQPKYNINNSKIIGAEALSRWKSPSGKLIPPDDFIPLCEKTGLIRELDMIILDKVLQFLKRNIDAGIENVPISVNFSRLHLLDKDFVEKILNKVQKYEVPASFIEIELTESAFFDNYEKVAQFINTLHSKGFHISMDDFGSGYSSLNMLKNLQIDVLKIDKEFLNETTNSDRQRIIFSTVAKMAQQLKIAVVVEGVEILEHVDLMKEVGCSIAQGYYYSRPVEEAIFESMIKGENEKC